MHSSVCLHYNHIDNERTHLEVLLPVLLLMFTRDVSVEQIPGWLNLTERNCTVLRRVPCRGTVVHEDYLQIVIIYRAFLHACSVTTYKKLNYSKAPSNESAVRLYSSLPTHRVVGLTGWTLGVRPRLAATRETRASINLLNLSRHRQAILGYSSNKASCKIDPSSWHCTFENSF